jgi:hypothetical protein
MEVTRKYNLSQWQEEIYCDNCFSESLAKPEDILFNKRIRYHLHYNYLEDYFYVCCPVCNAGLEIDQHLIPREMQRSISSKYNVVVPEKKISWGMWILITSPVWVYFLLLCILLIKEKL